MLPFLTVLFHLVDSYSFWKLRSGTIFLSISSLPVSEGGAEALCFLLGSLDHLGFHLLNHFLPYTGIMGRASHPSLGFLRTEKSCSSIFSVPGRK
jgi:hypothetical protein